MFSYLKVTPHIYHIQDQMGVCMTLIIGKDSSILLDTGYGTENVSSYIRSLTKLPCHVILTHGHHDHILGARWFSETWLSADDMNEFSLRTGAAQRRQVLQQALNKGISVPDDFLTAVFQMPSTLSFPSRFAGFETASEIPGGPDLYIMHIPGHTPGSLMAYHPDDNILVTGDNWNPCTWLWFPSAVPLQQWRKNMLRLRQNLDPFKPRILCSHQHAVYSWEEFTAYLDYITEDRIAHAAMVPIHPTIHTVQIENKVKGWTFVFDWDKYIKEREISGIS